jgi:Methyltransferase domain
MRNMVEFTNQAQQRKLLLNFGCGGVFHENWTNFDAFPSNKSVTRWNASKGIPLRNGVATACYSSHFLEHLSLENAKEFLLEAHRVLQPNGVIRIVVPDLEYNARLYLSTLEELSTLSSEVNIGRFKWATLNLFEQMIRVRHGGEMGRFWHEASEDLLEFAAQTTGGLESLEARRQLSGNQENNGVRKKIFRALKEPRATFSTSSVKLKSVIASFITGIPKDQLAVILC